jgi:hypothetical protein
MLKKITNLRLSLKGVFTFTILLLIIPSLYAQAPAWQWAVGAGGSQPDVGNKICVDNSDNCYVTGSFRGTANFGTHTVTSEGWDDIFVAKCDNTGNWLWAASAGGSSSYFSDSGQDIAVDSNGNVYVVGYFFDTANFGPYSVTSNGNNDMFVAKLDGDGNWQWVNSAGSADSDSGLSIAVDNNCNIYTTGFYKNTVYFGTYSITSSGWSDVFVAKLDQNGNWQWAASGGGVSSDSGRGIVTNNTGSCYVTGDFGYPSANFGTHSVVTNGSSDAFIAKIDSDGNWQWAASGGGPEWDTAYGIDIDGADNSYVTGRFASTATFGTESITSYGDNDMFVAKLDQNGNWQWAKGAGGAQKDEGLDVATNAGGGSYITGFFQDVAYFGVLSLMGWSERNIFTAKIDADGNWQWADGAGGSIGNEWDEGHGIALNDRGSCKVTGQFYDIVYIGMHHVTSNGSADIYVANMDIQVDADPELNNEISAIIKPNPACITARIQYSLKETAPVSMVVFNLKGQLIEILLEGNIQAGDYTVEWECQNVPSGIYFLKMKAGNEESVRKMILMR